MNYLKQNFLVNFIWAQLEICVLLQQLLAHASFVVFDTHLSFFLLGIGDLVEHLKVRAWISNMKQKLIWIICPCVTNLNEVRINHIKLHFLFLIKWNEIEMAKQSSTFGVKSPLNLIDQITQEKLLNCLFL